MPLRYLRHTQEIDAIESRLESIAGELALSTDTVARMPIGEFVGSENTPLSVTPEKLRSCWEDATTTSLPERCPHEVYADDTEYCLCHLSPEERSTRGIVPETVSTWIAESIQRGGVTNKQFVGARLNSLSLDHSVLRSDDTHPIDFRFAEIATQSNCRETVFDHDVLFTGALFGRDDSVAKTEAVSDTPNRFTDFIGTFDFFDATFEGVVDFKHAQFNGSLRLNSATFDGPTMCNFAQFSEQVDLMAATVVGKFDCSKATFEGPAQLNGTFHSAAIFNYTTFGDRVDFWSTTFHKKAEFWAATFRGPVSAQYSDFRGDVRFSGATFHDTVDFDDAAFSQAVYFRDVQSSDVISLQNALIAAGELRLPEKETPCYDLRSATVGDVTLNADPSRYDSLFSYLYIDRTTFDGFDFSACAPALRSDWKIHTMVGDGTDCFDPKTTRGAAAIEATYLKAKNGATSVGHNNAASQFFFHEMRARRTQHWLELKTARGFDRLGPLTRWSSNLILGVTSGYGERPRRVVGFSALVVVLFAFVFAFVDPTSAYQGRIGEGYLLLSFQSFITFILGSTPQQSTFALEVASAIEGFLGAFLIALLVFTLTRSIHR